MTSADITTLTRDRRGRIEATPQNIMSAIESQITVFNGRTMIYEGTAWRPLTDTDMIQLRETAEIQGFAPISKRRMREAIRMIVAKKGTP